MSLCRAPSLLDIEATEDTRPTKRRRSKITNWDYEAFTDEYVLRRTQQSVATSTPELALPPLETEVVKLDFSESEKAIYKHVESYYKEKVQQSRASSSSRKVNSHYALEGILRCRQLCTHPQIAKDALVDKLKLDQVFPDTYSSSSSSSSSSSKIDYLVKDIDYYSSFGSKCLVFCNWLEEMNLIGEALKQSNIPSLLFHGSLSKDKKEYVIYNFTNTPEIKVLILQINSGALGLNLQVADRVYITSPHWNPCIELQAIGRAYRKGQTERVFCVRVVMKESMEEWCLDVQNRKADMIREAMNDESITTRLMGASQGDDLLDDEELWNLFGN